jgi:hypothetical protein
MPQTATQRNQKATPRAPQPVGKTLEAETEDQVYGLVSVLYHSLQEGWGARGSQPSSTTNVSARGGLSWPFAGESWRRV